MRREIYTSNYYAEIRRDFIKGELKCKTVELLSNNKLEYLVLFNDTKMAGWEITEELFYELDLPFERVALTPSDFSYEKDYEVKRNKYMTNIQAIVNKKLLRIAEKKLKDNNYTLDTFITKALETYLLKNGD